MKYLLKQTILALAILSPLFCKAQHFTGQCDIPAVDESGYYHLLLSPEVIAVAQSGLEDIRIKNNKSGKEVPYLLRSENPKTRTSSFQDYKIIENYFDKKDSVTRLIIDNKAKEEIKQFCIVIENAEISKYISVRGSEDKKNWYVVKQKMSANPGMENDATSEILIVDIPLGKYRYYEISIGNPQKDPIRVLSVGKYQYGEILGKYTEVPLGSFVQKDSANKQSYIYFPEIKRNYLINKIHFETEDKQPYYRQACFSRKEYDAKRKNSFFVQLRSFILSSQEENTIDTYNMYMNPDIVVVIDNKDNNPLKINKITAYQLNRYLTIYLEKGEQYTLYFGDETLSKPQYDLEYFEKNIPGGLPVLELNPLKEISQSYIIDVKEHNFWETQTFLWIIISGVGLLLLWICYVMIKEMKKKREN